MFILFVFFKKSDLLSFRGKPSNLSLNTLTAVKAFKDARQKPARRISSEENKSEEQLTKQPEVTQHSNSGEHNQIFEQGKKRREQSVTDKRKKQNCKEEKQKTVDTEKKCPSTDSTLQTFEHHKLVPESQLEMTVHPERKKCPGALLYRAEDESDSDASNTAAEEEYFDDSTEERFYNQSSGPEESGGDDDDDFFIGKVKRMKKKGATDPSSLAKDKVKSMMVKNAKHPQSDSVQDPDVLLSHSNAKVKKLESIFYPSLSSSKQKSKNVKKTPRDHVSKQEIAVFGRKCPQKQLPKRAAIKQDLKRERVAQPLHPSWEASRKRREQTSQITAFQGKKIIFED
uniref:Uncharacterized protein n=1 Tax=Sphaerodactylus townsendi TaxID=933632 RepID=A0ACB8EQB4_9SAUR